MNGHSQLLVLLLALCSCVREAVTVAPPGVLPKEAVSALNRVSPHAVLIAEESMDQAACGPIAAHPGLVAADFSGDGNIDYAVLVRNQKFAREVPWNGRILHEAHFMLVLLQATGTTSFASSVVQEFDDFIPTIAKLSIYPPGSIRSSDGAEDVLQEAGFTLNMCEKSATTFFIRDGAVASLSIAD